MDSLEIPKTAKELREKGKKELLKQFKLKFGDN
jgi:hypothetical protein